MLRLRSSFFLFFSFSPSVVDGDGEKEYAFFVVVADGKKTIAFFFLLESTCDVYCVCLFVLFLVRRMERCRRKCLGACLRPVATEPTPFLFLLLLGERGNCCNDHHLSLPSTPLLSLCLGTIPFLGFSVVWECVRQTHAQRGRRRMGH